MASQHGSRYFQPDEADRQELRLAVAMTGGVSLAVWMGGVAAELRRLTSGIDSEGNPYRRLCELTGQYPTVDVVSGASAGGINGALLALATVRDAELDFVRDLWVDEGSLEQLLRAPTERAPRSLLRGDEYFLPTLRRAFDSIPDRRRGASSPPMRLLINTTLLQGESRSTTDDLGTVLREADHNGTFTFGTRDFDGDKDITAKLARAARCSASFPGAFEASFCRVGSTDGSPNSRDHPDMAGLVDTTISRFTVDGGLVNNKPVGPALQAVFDHVPNRPGRRVLTYVVPDPGASTYGEAERADSPPSLGRVLIGSLLEIPQAQSVTADLEALRRHNRRVKQQRYVREQILELGLVGDGTVTEERLTGYRRLRAEQDADAFLDELTRQLNGRLAAGRLPESWRGAYEFHAEAFRERRHKLVQAAMAKSAPSGGDAFDNLATYGPAAVERAGAAVLSLARRAAHLCVVPALRDRRREIVENITQPLLKSLSTVDSSEKARETLTGLLRDELEQAQPSVPDPLDVWATQRFEEWLEQIGAAASLDVAMLEICDKLALVGQHVDALVEWHDSHGLIGNPSREARRLQGAVRGLADRRHSTGETRRRLLALEVLQIVLALDRPVLDQQVQLVQVSAESRNGLTWHEVPSDKLTGLQLYHFGAFYRRSWRANDWLWGRVDTIGWLVHLLLAPARLQEIQEGLHLTSEDSRRDFVNDLMSELATVATGEGVLAATEVDWLTKLWQADEARVRDELNFLIAEPDGSGRSDKQLDGPDKLSLPTTSIAVARGLQYAVLLEELPKLRDDLQIDVDAGANGRPTAGWCKRFDSEWYPAGRERDPKVPVMLFGSCPLPRETLAAEAGSDLFTYTAATSAATGLRASSGAMSAIPGGRPLSSAARGAGVVTYLLARWTLLNNPRTVALSVLALMGGLLVMVLAENPLGDAIGLALVLGAAAFAALRASGRRWVRVLPPVLLTAASAALILGPWLWEPLRPESWLVRLSALVERHPLLYASVTGLLMLAGVGAITITWSAKRRQPLPTLLREALAKDIDPQLLLGIRVEPAVQRSPTVHLPSVRKAAQQLVQEANNAEARNAVLRIQQLSPHDATAGELLVLEHDGKADEAPQVHLRRWLTKRHVGSTVQRTRPGWTVLEVPIRRERQDA